MHDIENFEENKYFHGKKEDFHCPFCFQPDYSMGLTMGDLDGCSSPGGVVVASSPHHLMGYIMNKLCRVVTHSIHSQQFISLQTWPGMLLFKISFQRDDQFVHTQKAVIAINH